MSKTGSALLYRCISHVGMVRKENQDSYGVFTSRHGRGRSRPVLFVVADGMGGHRGGKEASALAVKTIGKEFVSDGEGNMQVSLANALQAANAAICSAGRENPDLSGMGTTCVALAVKGSSVFVAHIGDSRAYSVTEDGILQLTEDHSVVADMLRRGLVTAEQARTHPERSVLYRALGADTSADIDIQPEHVVREEEWFVLCSDGLTNMVENEEIHRLVMAFPPKQACSRLVALANKRGGYDNVTVIVVHVPPLQKEP